MSVVSDLTSFFPVLDDTLIRIITRVTYILSTWCSRCIWFGYLQSKLLKRKQCRRWMGWWIRESCFATDYKPYISQADKTVRSIDSNLYCTLCGNWMVIWRQVVSGIFVPKIIRIWWLVFKLQSKMSGMFFWDTV